MKSKKMFGVISLLLFASGVWAGEFHEEATARVNEAVSLMPVSLQAAEDLLKTVERDFPEELEAIGWAKYRLSEIYWAGMRWNDAAAAVNWAWMRIREGVLQDPDQRFWCGYQFARCLDKVGEMTRLAEVCRDTLEYYAYWDKPDHGKKTAAGWLHYYLAKSEYSAGKFSTAAQGAHAAGVIAKDVGDGALAGWAGIVEARVAMGQGNIILAEQILTRCLRDYAPHMDESYSQECRLRLAFCRAAMGHLSNAYQTTMEFFIAEGMDRGLKAEALVQYAEACLLQDATDEAILALTLARNAFRDVPTWGDIADHRWTALTEPGEERRAILSSVLDKGSDPIRAALYLEMARLAETPAEAEIYCASAETLWNRDRLGQEIRWVRATFEESTPDSEDLRTILAGTKNDYQKLVRIIEKIHGGAKERDSSGTYGSWLDEYAEVLPESFYRLEKARWLRGLSANKPEEALAIIEDALQSGLALASGLLAEFHMDRLICLGLLDRKEDLFEAVEEMNGLVYPDAERERILVTAGDILGYRGKFETAIEFFERILPTMKHPVWLRETLLVQATDFQFLDRNEEAIESLSQVIDLGPLEEGHGKLYVQALLEKGRLLFVHQGRTEEAQGLFREALGMENLGLEERFEAYYGVVRVGSALLGTESVTPEEIIEYCNEALAFLAEQDEAPPGEAFAFFRNSRENARAALGQ